MGFSFEKAVEKIEIRFDDYCDDGEGAVAQELKHVFRRPSADQIEKYDQIQNRLGGQSDSRKAMNYLWKASILEVHGYEGIPGLDSSGAIEDIEKVKQFFMTHDMAQTHVQKAVMGLLMTVRMPGNMEKN